jgi:FMN phosphatase YigB (HAD superfamily)
MKKIITFDFDETMVAKDGKIRYGVIELIRDYVSLGHECRIVTSRTESHEDPDWIRRNEPERIAVLDFIRDQMLPISHVHFTAHEPKGRTLRQIGSLLHYDDDRMETDSAMEFGVCSVLLHPLTGGSDTWKE